MKPNPIPLLLCCAIFQTTLAADEPDFGQRLSNAAKAALGTPYAAGPLGEGPTGVYDQDPLIDPTKVDCVTYVEQSIAQAAAPDKPLPALTALRYKNAQINFAARNHFWFTDWLENNAFCKDITQKLGVKTTPLTRTISRRDFFARVNAPNLGQATTDRKVTICYIAPEDAPSALQELPSPALITFIGKIDWLFALHCGLYIKDEQDQGKLHHASSKAGKVVAVDLPQYLAENAERYLGFTAHAINSPTQQKTPR